MEETTLLQYDFLATATTEEEKEAIRKKYRKFFNATEKKKVLVKALPLLKTGLISYTAPFQFRPDPFVSNYPPLVKDSSEVTLFDLDRGQYMFSASLPAACQELYANIKNLILEFPENPIMKLSDAIRYSIRTPGRTLYKKLAEKSTEFGPSNPAMIT